MILFPALKRQLDALESSSSRERRRLRSELTRTTALATELRTAVANVTAVVASLEEAMAAGQGESQAMDRQRCV